MRIYNDAMVMAREVERDLFEMGVTYQSETVQDKFVGDDKDYQTMELTAYQYSLSPVDLDDVKKVVEYLVGNQEWAVVELYERIFGSPNPGDAWERDRAKWGSFIRDGVFAYHYPERLSYQLNHVVRELQNRPSTRQAIMTMYDVHQDLMNWGGRDRVPCSLTYHFILRNSELTLIYNQRSCDFLKFFSTDVYITCGMLAHVARALSPNPERLRFVHVINSLHAFRKDMAARGVY